MKNNAVNKSKNVNQRIMGNNLTNAALTHMVKHKWSQHFVLLLYNLKNLKCKVGAFIIQFILCLVQSN